MFALDTNVVIFAINGRQPGYRTRLAAELARGTSLIIPVHVLYELRYGLAKSNQRQNSEALLLQFLEAPFQIADFTDEDAAEAGEIRAYLERNGTPIGPTDLLIAAQTRRLGAVLVTNNRREFERVPGLVVTDWA